MSGVLKLFRCAEDGREEVMGVKKIGQHFGDLELDLSPGAAQRYG